MCRELLDEFGVILEDELLPLGGKEEHIVSAFFGVCGRQEETMRQISNELEICYTHVSRLKTRTLFQLRHRAGKEFMDVIARISKQWEGLKKEVTDLRKINYPFPEKISVSGLLSKEIVDILEEKKVFNLKKLATCPFWKFKRIGKKRQRIIKSVLKKHMLYPGMEEEDFR